MGWENPADNEVMKNIATSANLEKNGRSLKEKKVIMSTDIRFCH